MYQSRVFCVKLQLHFGGDIHEISVTAYDGVEPTVSDLMNVIEHDFCVPRTLQNLAFHGQELHLRFNEPLSHFGIKNLATIRLVGRMAPVEMIPKINAQYQTNSYQQSNTIDNQRTNDRTISFDYDRVQYKRKTSVGTQYEPPIVTPCATPERME
jgi:hypothetical protein